MRFGKSCVRHIMQRLPQGSWPRDLISIGLYIKYYQSCSYMVPSTAASGLRLASHTLIADVPTVSYSTYNVAQNLLDRLLPSVGLLWPGPGLCSSPLVIAPCLSFTFSTKAVSNWVWLFFKKPLTKFAKVLLHRASLTICTNHCPPPERSACNKSLLFCR